MQKFRKFLGLILLMLIVFNCGNLIAARTKNEIVVFQPSKLGERLIEVAQNGYLDDVEKLVESGRIDQKHLNLALGWATNNGHIYVVKYLLENGADVNADDINKFGRTPLLVVSDQYKELGRKKCLKIIKILLENGADINKQNAGGGTALEDLAVEEELEGCIFLLENGARADIADRYGEYPYDGLKEGDLKDLLFLHCWYDQWCKFKVFNPFFRLAIKILMNKISS